MYLTLCFRITSPASTESTSVNLSSSSNNMYLETTIAQGIVIYLWPFIIFVGIFGNALSFCVLMRQSMCKTSVYFYLAVLALADIGVLLLSAFKTWIRVVVGFEFLHVSWITCKLTMYVFVICLHMSAWFVIAVTADRFIVIWIPLRSHGSQPSCGIFCHLNEHHRCKLVSVLIFLILFIYNGHLLWTIDLSVNSNGHYICIADSNNYFMVTIYPIMKLLSYCILPFVIVLFLNAAIIMRLSNSRRFVRSGNGASNISSPHQNRITGMLLTVSITWLILTGPFTIWSIVPQSNLAYSKSKSFLIKTICFTLMYTNHSINFFLYCLTGARFRNQLVDLVCPKSRRKSNNKIVLKSSRTTPMRMFVRLPLSNSRIQEESL